MTTKTPIDTFLESIKEADLLWLIDKFDEKKLEKLRQKANKEFREQIEDAHIAGNNKYTIGGGYSEDAKEYYEQTYGGEGDAQIFFTKDDMRKAFQAGEVSKNRAILRDEGYDLNSYDLPNIDGFEDWIENYA